MVVTNGHIPVILAIDVEPDGLFIDPQNPVPWRGFERSVEYFRAFRAGVEQRSQRPVHFTWVFRMDPQIEETYGSAEWAGEQYASLVSQLAADGDAFGVHPHAYRWHPQDRCWIVDHGNNAWIERCLETSLSAFARVFDRPCRILRFGDRWMSNDAVRWAESRGLEFDLTLEPGYPSQSANHPEERFTGMLPDYSAVPRHVYRPSIADYRRTEALRTSGIWMIPMSTARVRLGWRRRAYYRLIRPEHAVGRSTALVSHAHDLFPRIASEVIDHTDDRHLGLALRTGALANPRFARRVERNLAWLMRHSLAANFAWTTPSEAIDCLAPQK